MSAASNGSATTSCSSKASPDASFIGNVRGLSGRAPSALPLVQGLTSRRQGFQEERARLGRQATADRHGAVFSWIHVKGPAGVLPSGLVPLRLAVHPSPAPYDALDMLGSTGAADGEQALLGRRRRHPRERADLGVGQLAVRECLGQPRQRGDRARHAHLLSSRAEVETDAPRQPSAQERKPLFQPPRVSKSRMRSSSGRSRHRDARRARRSRHPGGRARWLKRVARGHPWRVPLRLRRLYTAVSEPPGRRANA